MCAVLLGISQAIADMHLSGQYDRVTTLFIPVERCFIATYQRKLKRCNSLFIAMIGYCVLFSIQPLLPACRKTVALPIGMLGENQIRTSH